ncbi:hypothetical protein [Streptomyces xanthii]|uniref:Secreted protein n=1 Tax=Streptomyces xanthii TaxID=2768069 RepID=A0A7H1B8H2_9ACTN|nr:hypothetical protein [Streptomyces xanthii]QNS05027.1 hypothetical protein IAG42_16360 [Streptomyces xanthii]
MSDEMPQEPEAPQEPGFQDRPAAPRRRRLTTVLVAGVVLLAVAGGVGFTVVTVRDADRTAATTVWGDAKEPKQQAGRHSGGDLRERLLPVPDGYVPGPDIDEFGNDHVITGQDAVDRFEAGSDDLPARQREARRKAVDKLRLKGLAMRSYASEDDDLVIETRLAEIGNRQVGRDLKDFQSGFLRALGVFKKGPAIKGHRNADCFLAPREGKDGLDLLTCSAYEDDLLVSVTAYGPKSLDTKAVADLLARQLDHISSRGEFV